MVGRHRRGESWQETACGAGYLLEFQIWQVYIMNAETIVSFLVCNGAGLFIELRAREKLKRLPFVRSTHMTARIHKYNVHVYIGVLHSRKNPIRRRNTLRRRRQHPRNSRQIRYYSQTHISYLSLSLSLSLLVSRARVFTMLAFLSSLPVRRRLCFTRLRYWKM